MDAVASVIAVLQITEQVGSLCYRYLKDAKNARADIERLQNELDSLKAVLKDAQKLLDGPHGAKFKTSQQLRDALKGCNSEAEKLKAKLDDKAKKTRGRWLRFGSLKWPFESEDVNRIIQTLHKHRDILGAALNIDQIRLLADSCERIEKGERLDILEWVSSIQYGKHHTSVKEARTPDTCEWLLQDDRFLEWERASSSTIMWLQGSPGAGKTFLTSRVIDHVQSQLEGSPTQEGFAFFYCNRNEEERRKPLSVLQSYARQLSAAVGHLDEIQKNLRGLWYDSKALGKNLGFEACKNQLLKSVNLYQRSTLVLDALDECDPSSRSRLIEVIDFLLSSTEKPLRVFISSRPDGDIRDLFLSRPNIEIQATDNKEDIKKFVNEEIVKHRRWDNISSQLQETVVQTILTRSEGMFQWAFLQIRQLLEVQTKTAIESRLGKLPNGLEAAYDEIYSQIATRNEYERILADRAFKWVMCACEPLTSDELLSAIRLDPEDITHMSEEVDEALMLDLCRNLLVLDSQRNVWRFSHLSVTEYFEKKHWCLWQAHCHAAKVCLAHLIETYTEPKTSHTGSLHDSHGHDSRARSIFDPQHSFQNYSQRYWIVHVQNQEEQEADPALVNLLKAFLGSPEESSSQYRQWYLHVRKERIEIQSRESLSTSGYVDVDLDNDLSENCSIFLMCRFSLYNILSDWWHDKDLPLLTLTKKGNSLLSIASLAGYRPICETLLKRGAQVNPQTGEHGSALAAAAERGNKDIVQYLVEKGADVNLLLQTGEYGSALAAAAWGGKKDIVEYLVEKGADVNLLLQTGQYGSALAAAAERGNKDIVQYLVEKGADVNLLLQTGEYGSALAAAAERGEKNIVKYLVKKGADVNLLLQTGQYGSALAAAAAGWRGEKDIVQYLIEKGADVNVLLQTGRYGSALAAAAWGGEKDIVKYLVEKGADVNLLLQTGRYGSALAAAAAACKGNKDIVEYLVEKGADVNLLLQTGWCGSALVAAAGRGNKDIVQYLVEKGADINPLLQAGRYGSALAAAAWEGEKDIVEYLVEKGADVNVLLQTGRYGSALAAAAWEGEKDIVEYLVEKGADVNVLLQTGQYGSALAAAAAGWRGEKDIVQYLVEKGADVNLLLQTGEYGSALAAAAWRGKNDIVEYLVEKGADVNVLLQTGQYGSALAAAAAGWRGEKDIVQYLVEKGADVNLLLQTGEYGSALAAAAWEGEKDIVEYLVEKGADVNVLLQTGRYGSALAAAAHYGWKQCVEILIDAGADVKLELENGAYRTAFHAAQADMDKQYYDSRSEETRKQEKAEVVELLRRKIEQ